MWHRRSLRAAAAAAAVCFASGPAQGADPEIAALREELGQIRSENRDIKKQLQETSTALRDVEAQVTASASARPTAPRPSESGGAPRVRLVDVSLSTLAAAGTSNKTDDEIALLEGGGHDPRRRGFTLQQAELSLMGAVDPYFTGEAHLVYFIDTEGESQFELEEAFLTTQALPHGLQLEAGQFFTEFGRMNPRHPHAWHWEDQPVILTRLFGADGMRGQGFRLGWLTPLPWFSEVHVGAQNANGETMTSFVSSEEAFDEAPIGGRPFVGRNVHSPNDLVYLARWVNSIDLTEDISTQFGVSALFGPNPTGNDEKTRIYGADLVAKWRPSGQRRGWPFAVFESEVAQRDYEAAATPGLPSETLKDFGLYAQALYGFYTRWAAGARYEYATGSGASVGGRENDVMRDDRARISPLLAFYPSEFSRIRLQYNLDHADHLSSDAHSVWLGVDFGLGAHPAHEF